MLDTQRDCCHVQVKTAARKAAASKERGAREKKGTRDVDEKTAGEEEVAGKGEGTHKSCEPHILENGAAFLRHLDYSGVEVWYLRGGGGTDGKRKRAPIPVFVPRGKKAEQAANGDSSTPTAAPEREAKLARMGSNDKRSVFERLKSGDGEVWLPLCHPHCHCLSLLSCSCACTSSGRIFDRFD